MDLFVTVDELMSLDKSVAILIPLVEGFTELIVHLLCGQVAHHEGERSLAKLSISL